MTEAEAQALINEAAGIDAGQAAHGEAAAAGMLDEGGNIVLPDEMAKAAEWFLIPKTLAWAITTVFPETRKHYTDAACMDLAKAIVPVAEKYGLTGIGDCPELSLLVATGMFCVPGYMAHKQRKALELEEERARREGADNGG
ncbi:hypothetical protein [Duganella sp. BuS-21]|uniref:hypothetical protein n=1 Tax=Duganella sp. BuS-21 TaxID=2943848 RepID=UPI0035A63D77